MVSQRKDKTSYSVIGVMAGSSMDGLDLAHANFTKTKNEWKYKLGKCNTIRYPEALYSRLKQASQQRKEIQDELDIDFGNWIAQCIVDFKNDLPPIDILGVHGHTVIHKPHEKISWQLGNGATIANRTKISTVTDFRMEDVQNGGQGAPLVPFGDFILFDEYDACINLGGIANISINQSKTAWDICPCNQVLNFLSEKLGSPFDKNGSFARSGTFNTPFHTKISALDYFAETPPKSLPNNFIDPVILNSIDPKDGLHTYCQIIVEQVLKSIPDSGGSKLLLTGGGAFNGYLVELLKRHIDEWIIHVPDEELISFKESLIFAFLALKRSINETNTLSSVTGASKDTSSGVIHLPE